MRTQRVVIVGGSIGGMALAAALHKVGFEAHVYERAPQITEVGAGIALWPNARASMAQLGAAERALRSCEPLHKLQLLSHRGKVLSTTDLAAEWPGIKEAVFHIVHRADLLAALTEQCPPDRVHTSHACAEIEFTENGARGSATLVGDAAHPTTPNLGQGANMAIADALVLARSLREAPDAGLAFTHYEATRRARTAMIVRRSWTFGTLCRWQSPTAVWLREELLQRTPKALLRAEMHQQIFARIPAIV